MPSLKDLKNRIKSVKSTQKITKAMKMVAAAKLRRAKEAAEAARPYAQALEAMLANLASGAQRTGDGRSLLAGTGKDDVRLVIVATSDRGLCGAFNSSIVRATRKRVRELLAAGKTVKLYCVGRKGAEQLHIEFGRLMVAKKTEVGKRRLAYTDAETIALDVIQRFEAGEFDVAEVVYNRFKSAIAQVVTWQRLVPLPVASSPLPENTGNAQRATGNVPYEYEPDEEAVLADLLPHNIGVQLYKALLENAASEQGARMSAMDNATRNAGEMIKKLTLKYNRSRQAAITKELIEIISGAEAV